MNPAKDADEHARFDILSGNGRDTHSHVCIFQYRSVSSSELARIAGQAVGALWLLLMAQSWHDDLVVVLDN
ncbi:hypothetical protein ACLKA6_008937 [Drosophila palustris]